MLKGVTKLPRGKKTNSSKYTLERYVHRIASESHNGHHSSEKIILKPIYIQPKRAGFPIREEPIPPRPGKKTRTQIRGQATKKEL